MVLALRPSAVEAALHQRAPATGRVRPVGDGGRRCRPGRATGRGRRSLGRRRCSTPPSGTNRSSWSPTTTSPADDIGAADGIGGGHRIGRPGEPRRGRHAGGRRPRRERCRPVAVIGTDRVEFGSIRCTSGDSRVAVDGGTGRGDRSASSRSVDDRGADRRAGRRSQPSLGGRVASSEVGIVGDGERRHPRTTSARAAERSARTGSGCARTEHHVPGGKLASCSGGMLARSPDGQTPATRTSSAAGVTSTRPAWTRR